MRVRARCPSLGTTHDHLCYELLLTARPTVCDGCQACCVIVVHEHMEASMPTIQCGWRGLRRRLVMHWYTFAIDVVVPDPFFV